MKKLSITIVPRQLGILLDQMFDKIITEATNPPVINQQKDLMELVKYDYNEDYDVYQGTCYQQYSPNLCGYHAIFNTFCALKMINGGSNEYNINSGVSFWKFKLKVQNFLTKYKKKHRKTEEWPWRTKDIENGDFERTYNKVCMEQFDEFKIFRAHQNFYYMTDTWEFQYQNLLASQSKIEDLQNKFAQFRLYEGQKPLVLHLMLAITTHWLTFLAINRGGHFQYWFFDSFNNHYLNFSWEQIVEFVQAKSKDRVKYKKPQFTPFQKESYSMCMKDIQTSIKLIIKCLKGEQSLTAYSYNRKFNIFGDHLEKAMNTSHQRASIVIQEYQHNIRAFFMREIQWNLFTEHNQTRMKKLINYSKIIKRQSREGKYFHQLLKIHNRI